jgi:hypothetical protein
MQAHVDIILESSKMVEGALEAHVDIILDSS